MNIVELALLTGRWTGAVLFLLSSAIVILIYAIRIFRAPSKDDVPITSPLFPGHASFLAVLGLLLSPTREPVWVWVLFVALDVLAGLFACRRYVREWKALSRRLEGGQNGDGYQK